MFYKIRQRLKRFNHYKKGEVEQAPLVAEKKPKGKPKTSKKVEGETK